MNKTACKEYKKIQSQKKKAGRNKIEIDYELVEKLAHIFCTKDEIAVILDIDRTTAFRDEKFTIAYEKGREGGKMSLRRMQIKLAEKNSTMAIWLGKQYLGQRDLIEEQSTKPISVISDVRNEDETEQNSASSAFQSNGDDYNVIDVEDEGK